MVIWKSASETLSNTGMGSIWDSSTMVYILSTLRTVLWAASHYMEGVLTNLHHSLGSCVSFLLVSTICIVFSVGKLEVEGAFRCLHFTEV